MKVMKLGISRMVRQIFAISLIVNFSDSLVSSDALDYEKKEVRLPEHYVVSETLCQNNINILNEEDARKWIDQAADRKMAAFNQKKALALKQFSLNLPNYTAFKKEYDLHYSKVSGRWFWDSRSRVKDCSFLWHAYRCHK